MRGPATGPWMQIVGVVADFKHRGLAAPVRPEMFQPHEQIPFSWGSGHLVVWTAPEATDGLISRVRDIVRQIDPDQPITRALRLDDLIASSVAQPRLNALLFGTLGGLALLLGVVGIYGVVSYTARQRVREVGIRMALGARRTDVYRLFLSVGLVPVIVGMLAGGAAALMLSRLLVSLLHDISAQDPATYTLASLLLVSVAAGASYLPARWAARQDPAASLRDE